MSGIIISPPPPAKPINWNQLLSAAAVFVALGAAIFSGLQYCATKFALITEQRPWLNLENTVVNTAPMAATFHWKNRGKTPALNVESFEWDVLRIPGGNGFRTVYTSEKRHSVYGSVWADGPLITATLATTAAKTFPPIEAGETLRLLGLVTYTSLFGANRYHVYYCYDVPPHVAAMFPCPEPELNRVD